MRIQSDTRRLVWATLILDIVSTQGVQSSNAFTRSLGRPSVLEYEDLKHCPLGTPPPTGDSRCIRVCAASPRSVEGRGAVPGRRDARIHCASMAVRLVLVLDAIDISIPSPTFNPHPTFHHDS